MKRTLLSAAAVGVLAAVAGVVAGLMVGEPQTERVERISKAPPTLVAVPVVLKDIPVGTKVTAENVGEFCEFRLVPKADVPPDAAVSLCDTSGSQGRRALRTIRQGEVVSEGDLGDGIICEMPGGTVFATVAVTTSPREVGLTLVGYKVLVLATKWSEAKGKDVVLPLFLDALILEVEPVKSGVDERQVSFAVTPEQSVWLAAVVDGGATIRIGLPENRERSAYETDTHIMCDPALSFDDVREFLRSE